MEHADDYDDRDDPRRGNDLEGGQLHEGIMEDTWCVELAVPHSMEGAAAESIEVGCRGCIGGIGYGDSTLMSLDMNAIALPGAT